MLDNLSLPTHKRHIRARLMKKLLSSGLALLFAAATVTSAQAQADLSFSGGSGAPLSITLLQPVAYTITTDDVTGAGPVFLFQGIDNPLMGTPTGVSGNMTYEIDGGPPLTLTEATTGYSGGDVNTTDFVMEGNVPGVYTNDVVILYPGTLTTTIDIAAPAPGDGMYDTFIINGTISARVSQNGVMVPEPSVWALTACGAVALGWTLRRRRAVADR